jgi:prophage antirepressor-like protein
MNELQVYTHERFGSIEAILIDGKPYFPATQCAEHLEYSNPRDAILRHCRGVVKHDVGVQTGVKADGTSAIQIVSRNFIPLSDLIRLIMHSKMPAAQEFEVWVVEEIVPSVLRHGMFVKEELLTDIDTFIAALQALKAERETRKLCEAKVNCLEERLDEAQEWYSIKRWAYEHDMDWRHVGDVRGAGQGWRRLKALSHEHGYEIKRCFDSNYGEINLYHKNVFGMLA